MQLKMTVTRDAANVITGATYDFTINVTGFPAGTTVTGAHIHTAPAGTNAGVVVGLPLVAADTTLATGQSTIVKTGVSSTSTTVSSAAVAQSIFNNPVGNYFNLHTSVNGGGAICGQLVRLD